MPMLQNASTFVRGTALELLLKMYAKSKEPNILTFQHTLPGSKGRSSKPGVIISAIPDIIAFAFDDKPESDVERIRITAVQLLAVLASDSIKEPEPTPLTAGDYFLPFPSDSDSDSKDSELASVPGQITPFASEFMTLLEVEHLRPSVVKLLSLISTDATGKHLF
jgi:hypothetical protein